MEIVGRQSLLHVIRNIESSSEYQQILGVLLKYEIQILLQRLAETGEESVVMSMSVADGTLSVIGSDHGERFIQNPGSAVHIVTDFKEQFVRYCHNAFASKSSSNDLNDNTGIQSSDSSSTPSEGHSPSDSTCRLKRGRPARLKQVDKTDQTVAELVKNIMKQTKEKETSNQKVHTRTIYSQRGRKKRVLERGSVKVQKEKQPYLSEILNQENKINKKTNKTNTSVDDTVSQLVEKIKAQAEVKEKEKSKILSCFHLKRKQSQNFEYATDLIDVTQDTCSNKKPKTIAECFPTLTDSLDTTSNYSPSISTKVKIEPCDNGYEYVLNSKTVTDQASQLHGLSVVNEGRESNPGSEHTGYNSVVECSNDSVDFQQIDTRKTGGYGNVEASSSEMSQTMIENGTQCSEEESGTEVDVTSVKIEIDTDYEEDIELPYVEEYYENRGKNCARPPEPDYYYKTSAHHKGGINLVYKGYRYIKDKEGKGNTIYWKCGRFQCKGRVIQRNGENIPTQDHNHSPTFMFESMKKNSSSITW